MSRSLVLPVEVDVPGGRVGFGVEDLKRLEGCGWGGCDCDWVGCFDVEGTGWEWGGAFDEVLESAREVEA